MSAPVGCRKFSAHSRPGVIYLALSGYRIQKSAGLSQHRICFATQNPLGSVVGARKPHQRGFVVHAEMPRQAVDIPFRNLNAFID